MCRDGTNIFFLIMILPLSLIARNVPPDTINSAIQSKKLYLLGITLNEYIANPNPKQHIQFPENPRHQNN